MLLEIVFPPLLQYVLDDVDDAHLLFSLFHYPPALAIFVSALVLLNREIQNLSSLSYFRLQKQRFSDICRYFFSFFLALSLSRCNGPKTRRSDILQPTLTLYS